MQLSMNDKVYVALGSNLGDREVYLARAQELLQANIVITKQAPVYETKPVSGVQQPLFLNTVIECTTALVPEKLLFFCQYTEFRLGRTRTIPEGPRTIDIDVLLYKDAVVNEPYLVIPHPRLHERLFVLQPLCAIAPDLVHPVLGKTVQQLYEELKQNANE